MYLSVENGFWTKASSRITLSPVRTTQWTIDSGTMASARDAASKRTTIVSPLVVASASARSSSPRGRINRPRSAPACSTAMRISVSISFSKTISPETACETLITVAKSRCSTGVPMVLVRPGTGSSSLSRGYNSSSCRTLPVASQRR